MRKKNLAIALLLFFIAACAGEKTVSLSGHDAMMLYHTEQYEVLYDRLTRSDRGFDSYTYFPYSANLLVRQAMATKDPAKLARAIALVASLSNDQDDVYLAAYGQMLPGLLTRPSAPPFRSANGEQCTADSKTLGRLFVEAAGTADAGRLDGAYWYSVYVNTNCSSRANRAVYLSLLAEVDLNTAASELQRIQAIPASPGAPPDRLMERICSLKKYFVVENNGIEKLTEKGLIQCASEG